MQIYFLSAINKFPFVKFGGNGTKAKKRRNNLWGNFRHLFSQSAANAELLWQEAIRAKKNEGKKKKEIIIEVERVRVTCKRTNRYGGWCQICRGQVEFLTALEAAVFLNVQLQTIARNLAAGAFHEHLLPDGTLLVCLNSILHDGQQTE